jgi:hypothetical protein
MVISLNFGNFLLSILDKKITMMDFVLQCPPLDKKIDPKIALRCAQDNLRGPKSLGPLEIVRLCVLPA